MSSQKEGQGRFSSNRCDMDQSRRPKSRSGRDATDHCKGSGYKKSNSLGKQMALSSSKRRRHEGHHSRGKRHYDSHFHRRKRGSHSSSGSSGGSSCGVTGGYKNRSKTIDNKTSNQRSSKSTLTHEAKQKIEFTPRDNQKLKPVQKESGENLQDDKQEVRLNEAQLKQIGAEILDYSKQMGVFDEMRMQVLDRITKSEKYKRIELEFQREIDRFCSNADLNLPRAKLREQLGDESLFKNSASRLREYIRKTFLETRQQFGVVYSNCARIYLTKQYHCNLSAPKMTAQNDQPSSCANLDSTEPQSRETVVVTNSTLLQNSHNVNATTRDTTTTTTTTMTHNATDGTESSNKRSPVPFPSSSHSDAMSSLPPVTTPVVVASGEKEICNARDDHEEETAARAKPTRVLVFNDSSSLNHSEIKHSLKDTEDTDLEQRQQVIQSPPLPLKRRADREDGEIDSSSIRKQPRQRGDEKIMKTSMMIEAILQPTNVKPHMTSSERLRMLEYCFT